MKSPTRLTVNQRWTLATNVELPFAPLIFGIWDDLPRLCPDATALNVLRAVLVEWQRDPTVRDEDFPTRVQVSQTALAATLLMTDRGVRKALGRLVEMKLLSRPRASLGQTNFYDVRPTLLRVEIELPEEHGSSVARRNGVPLPPSASEERGSPTGGTTVLTPRNDVPPGRLGKRDEKEREKNARARALLPLLATKETKDSARAAIRTALDGPDRAEAAAIFGVSDARREAIETNGVLEGGKT